MKKIIFYIVLSFLIGSLYSCYINNENNCRKGKPDKKYDFMESVMRQYDFDYLSVITNLREFGTIIYGDSAKFNWIRQPDNMKKFYNTLKHIGIFKFISQKDFNKPLFTNLYRESCWNNKSLNDIIGNLIKSYSDSVGMDKYYIEFWQRREKEKNDKIAYKILCDLHKTYNEQLFISDISADIDTLISSLLIHEITINQSDSVDLYENIIDFFYYLVAVDMNASASNLIHFYDGDMNFRKTYNELIKKVETDSVDCNEYWDWRYGANWIKDIYDDGP